MDERLYLVDASVFVFRAWFSIPEGVVDGEGNPANAVFGFGSFLCDLLERQRPARIAVAFDESLGSCFRNELYPDYKANRPPPPPDLERQFEVCRALVGAMGLACLSSRRFEADDLIGSAARFHERRVYVTSDKDLTQLVAAGDQWWDPGRGLRLDAAGVERTLGVPPAGVPDLLALAGDSIDNIPGVPGVGRKTAAALLGALHTLDGVYQGLGRIAGLGLRGAARVRGLLETHREQAFLCRELTRIRRDAPLGCEAAHLDRPLIPRDAADAVALPVQLRSRLRRLAREAG